MLHSVQVNQVEMQIREDVHPASMELLTLNSTGRHGYFLNLTGDMKLNNMGENINISNMTKAIP